MNLIKDNFKRYSIKTDSDYTFIFNGETIPINIALFSPEEMDGLEKHGNKLILTKYLVDKLSPDNLDPRKFWIESTMLYPLYSICGSCQGKETVENINRQTLNMSRVLGVLNVLINMFDKNPETKMLEIGPGYGNIKDFIIEHYNDKNYYAIDVNPLFKHDRIYQTNGSRVPKQIPFELDIIYAMNVFQHLSKKQRTAYYKASYKRLRMGGVFVFGMFVETKVNKDFDCWHYRDTNNRKYVWFFNQFTIVDQEEELIKELMDIGFSVRKLSRYELQSHYLTFECIKT